MIRIAISSAAFEAIAGTLPLGSIAYEAESDAKGDRLIWLPRSDVIFCGYRGSLKCERTSR
jgi:hypothetical protein